MGHVRVSGKKINLVCFNLKFHFIPDCCVCSSVVCSGLPTYIIRLRPCFRLAAVASEFLFLGYVSTFRWRQIFLCLCSTGELIWFQVWFLWSSSFSTFFTGGCRTSIGDLLNNLTTSHVQLLFQCV